MQWALTAELVGFLCLGLYLRSPTKNESILYGFLLGLATGLGFWVAIPWVLMCAMVAMAVIPKASKLKELDTWAVVLGFLILFSPYLFFSWMGKNGDHIKQLWEIYRHEDLALSLKNLFSNWTILFWEGIPANTFGPVWGGILNPIEGAFCFLGIIQWIRSMRSPLSSWLLVSAFVFTAPGLVTDCYDSFRNLLLVPILIVACVCGAQMLLLKVPARGRPSILFAILLASSSLNLAHWAKSYLPFSPDNPNLNPVISEEVRSYSILDQIYRQANPGFILWDLSTFREHNLRMESYPFNVADNPLLPPSKAHWVALFCNSYYRRYLQPRFPESLWYEVGPDLFWHEGGYSLVVLPLNDSNRLILAGWIEANARMHVITRKTLFDDTQTNVDNIQKQLIGMESAFEKDPFLESMFCERVLEKSGLGHPNQWLPLIEKPLQKCYSSPLLLRAKGALLDEKGRHQEALIE